MKLPKHVALTSVVLAGALALAGCGSDDNSSDGASDSTADESSVSGTLNGEGSSAQKNAIDEVIASFGDANPDATVNYNPTGSGDGVSNFIAGQVDWAGSDAALSDEESDGTVETEAAAERCDGNEAWNLPMVAGPIAIAYNLPGVDTLVLTPDVIAKIFLGDITSWDDDAIAEINPDVDLPSTAISVFFRSDESGTTYNFENYLAGSAPDLFTEEPAKTWPGKAGQGRSKSDGVTQGVASTEGGITYTEWSYATDADLGVAQVDNGAGAVELTGETAGAALTAAEVVGEGNDLKLQLDYATTQADTYPIVLVTYEIVCSAGLDEEKTTLLKAFLTHFADADTQSTLQDIGYAPLPDEIQSKVETAIAAIS